MTHKILTTIGTHPDLEVDEIEDQAHKGKPNGYPSLDSDGEIPENQIPSSIVRDVDLTAHNVPDMHSDTKVRSKVVDETDIGDDKILVYKLATDKLVYEVKPTGGGGGLTNLDGGAADSVYGGIESIDCGGA